MAKIAHHHIHVSDFLLKVAVAATAIAVVGCGRAPSETDVKVAIERHMKEGNSFGERYVDLDKLCSGVAHKAGKGKYQGVDRVIEIGARRKESRWHTFYAWPVKVELRLECEYRGHVVPLSATQEFELRKNDSWEVERGYWLSPEFTISDPIDDDIFRWEWNGALMVGFALSLVVAAAMRPAARKDMPRGAAG